ncbi:MAG: DoxX family protein [Ferruginibacter sp.]
MEKLVKPGRIIFALGIIALAILSFISKDFIIGRPPSWPAGFTANPSLAYISAVVLIISAIAVIFEIKPIIASIVIAALIFLLSVLRHLPQFMNDWLNGYKAMALFGGALIVAASFLNVNDISRALGANKRWKNIFVITGSILLAAFLMAAGYAHFKFAAFVKDFIPAYIPFREFWTYFTGVCLCAGGVGLLLPPTKKWAALLSGIMIGGWFLLLHIPRVIANTKDVGDRMGLFESFAFAGIFFVLASIFSRKKSF